MAIETLGAFLKACRDKTDPEAVGLDPGRGRRRVPGLRREEIARLAGVSVGYYTRIEQGQTAAASAQVLYALASVMRLTDTEKAHLSNLASSPPRQRLVREAAERPYPRVVALLGSLRETIPAVVLGRRGDILAWNHAGHELCFPHYPYDAPGDPERRPSVPWSFFLDPLVRDLYANWDDLAPVHVAYLRLTAGRYPGDARLAELIGELSIRSSEFSTLWARGEVADCTVGNMVLAHPTLGRLDLDYQVWLQPESPDHRLEIYTRNDNATADALALLPDPLHQVRPPRHRPDSDWTPGLALGKRPASITLQ
ncbi:MAG: helix-turn-helix transcriptional regulator [Bifidobacteriaceae bacterium]|jgi:transcriptional regulator with XRE-family HTH domain|nr:helix-turn-helix transcriptional regulator [Bifidobacteriaceae bacterium]